MQFQVDIKQLLLNNVATLHAEDLTQNDVLIQHTTKIYTAWFGLFYDEQCTARAHVRAELCLNVDFSVGELDRIHSPSLIKYPVFNTFIILSFFWPKFVSVVRKKQSLY